ncbi:MAG: hypothetical protein Q4D07_08820 [Selenomonadaceae bacterium]|nr:hypothetical protein [Selenomonadaceae bacterium]
MKTTLFNKKALAVLTVAAAITGLSSVAFAKDKAPSDDGVWFGGAEAFYEDFTPEAVKRNEKEQAKAEEKSKKDAVKAKKRREKDAQDAVKREQKAEKRRAQNEAKDARRAEKAQKKTVKEPKPAKETAKRKKGQPGELQPSDLTYKGLALGDNVAAMRKHLGEPDFDQESRVNGIPVRYYIYGRNLRVGVFETMGGVSRVADIVIRDEGYKGRNNVRYGSTPYHVFETYGKGQRQPIDNKLYYVFESNEPGHKRLLIEYQAPDNIVVSWRITSLPLSEAEADRRFEEFEPAAVATDIGALMIRQKDIDTSEVSISDGKPQINIAID